MSMLQIFDSVGIELETELVPRGSRSINGFSSTHDASIESEFESILGLPVVSNESNLKFSHTIFGSEFITRGTLDTSCKDSYINILKNLTDSLFYFGEKEKSYRAGFHVHVNYSSNLKLLQYLLKLCANLEQIFFLLGTMGYDYRGKQNNSCYCRPITRSGPICVPYKRSSFAQSFTLSDLYAAKNLTEFKDRYGDYLRLYERTGRYLPVRYHWLNLKPCFEQGSIEFRVFNKSLNPYYLYAIIEFCKRVVKYATYLYISKDKPELIEKSIFDIKYSEQKPSIINDLIEFMDTCGLREDPEVFEILLEIAEKGDINSIILPEEYIYSHLMFHREGNRVITHWEESEYSPNRIPKEKIKKPNFIDIGTQRIRRTSQNSPGVFTTTDYSTYASESNIFGVRNNPTIVTQFIPTEPEEEVEEDNEEEEEYDTEFGDIE